MDLCRWSFRPDRTVWDFRMTALNLDESKELIRLYETLTLAVERASSTMHMHGMDSAKFATEDAKCIDIWNRIRALIEKKSA
jgi:hypothetical protein